jgi:hypothetical protein
LSPIIRWHFHVHRRCVMTPNQAFNRTCANAISFWRTPVGAGRLTCSC